MINSDHVHNKLSRKRLKCVFNLFILMREDVPTLSAYNNLKYKLIGYIGKSRIANRLANLILKTIIMFPFLTAKRKYIKKCQQAQGRVLASRQRTGSHWSSRCPKEQQRIGAQKCHDV